MKKLILIFSILGILLTSNSYSQTGWINYSTGINRSLRDIYFVNANTGWAVGDTTAIFKSTNGGLNWFQQNINYVSPVILYTVKFLNENTGFTAGGFAVPPDFYYNYIYKTTNGGNNWYLIYNVQGSANASINNMFLVDENTFYLTTEGTAGLFVTTGGVLKTTNGGTNFNLCVSYGQSQTVFFINPNTGWANSYYTTDVGLSKTRILKTTNAGLNWSEQYNDSLSNSSIIYKIQFFDNNTGYAIGRGGDNVAKFFKTTNSGVNWSNTVYPNGKYKTMFFTNLNTGWVGGSWYPYSSCVSYTTNGGLNWSLQKEYYVGFINNLYFINNLTGWAAMNSGDILKTTTGGVYTPPDTSSATYFPLQVGNKYLYYYVDEVLPPSSGYFISEITKDTIINGYRYFYLNHFPDIGYGWVRYDSARSNLLYYTPGANCSGYSDDKIIDSLGSNLNDTIQNSCIHGNLWSILKCSDTSTQTLFNTISVKTKYFHKDGLAYGYTRYAKYFGIMHYDFGEPIPHTYNVDLKGCIINGVGYGDTSWFVYNHSISGTVRYTDNNQPVTSGVVKAIKLEKSSGSLIILDTALIQSDGTYTLPNVPADSLYIGLYPNSGSTPDYVISYYPEATDWQNATVLYPTQNLNNIDLGATRMYGTDVNNSVSGKVMRVNLSMAGNIKDAVLYARRGNRYVGCTTSDENGVYHLRGLQSGILRIVVNRIGFSSDRKFVYLTSTGNIDSINFSLVYLLSGINHLDTEIPTEYKLYQNYPNPFNPTTKIRFDISPLLRGVGEARGVLTQLKIYDITGREIATLISESLQPGIYETTFDGTNFASGVYFYRIIAGDFIATKKMLLIK